MTYDDPNKRRDKFRRWYYRGEPPPRTALDEYAVMSQTEVAAALGISRQLVDRAERSAFAKLRKRPSVQALWQELKR